MGELEQVQYMVSTVSELRHGTLCVDARIFESRWENVQQSGSIKSSKSLGANRFYSATLSSPITWNPSAHQELTSTPHGVRQVNFEKHSVDRPSSATILRVFEGVHRAI